VQRRFTMHVYLLLQTACNADTSCMGVVPHQWLAAMLARVPQSHSSCTSLQQQQQQRYISSVRPCCHSSFAVCTQCTLASQSNTMATQTRPHLQRAPHAKRRTHKPNPTPLTRFR
jgi:hypothetical protein